ncbi:hypothetical protein DKX38_007267 [Salix brachista]|uniref:Uncharacterized protein n=1 Tax=Salix brachista TaxID=2182728 RepID=A0A5N5MN51_9ROSI|nr:hypothetical protein DKX38_007267 [Salix brachista]
MILSTFRSQSWVLDARGLVKCARPCPPRRLAFQSSTKLLIRGSRFLIHQMLMDSEKEKILVSFHRRLRIERDLVIAGAPYCPVGRGFFGGRGVVESLPSDDKLA